MNVNIMTERGSVFIYHWVVYMLGGLRHYKNTTPSKIIINYKIPDTDYIKESIDCLEETGLYTFQNKETTKDDVSITQYGEPVCNGTCDKVDYNTFYFLRKTFNSFMDTDIIKSKYIYISRNKYITVGHNNVKKRHIINEEELYPILKEYGFEIISLEEYSFRNKIKLFSQSELIISPISGGLTFSLFANKNTHIIELGPVINHVDHYKHICQALDISYIRFNNVEIFGSDCSPFGNWNMNINIIEFEKFLKHKINNLNNKYGTSTNFEC